MNQSVTRELKLLGKSPEITQVRKAIKNAARILSNVMLIGETGTGKHFIAEHLHRLSRNANHPFIEIQCGAIGDTIDPEDVFSNKKGKEGKIYNIGKGTVYLDRVDKLETKLQDRLYNFLTTENLSNADSPQSARIISSIESSESEMLKNNAFRQDLFQQLAEFRIFIPPLRDRKQDIPFLFSQILEELSQEYGKSMPTIPADVFEAILDYHWPGNLFEMRNSIRNMIIMAPEDELSASYLPFYSKPDPLQFFDGYDLPTAVSEVEKYLIKRALAKYEGNQSKAARMLQVSEAALRYKMKKYDFPSAR